MILFETASGSAYEVDADTKCIRRLSGSKDPSPRQGADGAWKAYADLSSIVLGEPVAIFWPDGTPLLDGSPVGTIPSTITSPVVRSSVRL